MDGNNNLDNSEIRELDFREIARERGRTIAKHAFAIKRLNEELTKKQEIIDSLGLQLKLLRDGDFNEFTNEKLRMHKRKYDEIQRIVREQAIVIHNQRIEIAKLQQTNKVG